MSHTTVMLSSSMIVPLLMVVGTAVAVMMMQR